MWLADVEVAVNDGAADSQVVGRYQAVVVDGAEVLEDVWAVGAGVPESWRVAEGVAGGGVGLNTVAVEAIG